MYVRLYFDKVIKHPTSGLGGIDNPHDDYAGALYKCSSRYMIYELDILDAFQGVCNIAAERMGTEYTNEMNDLNGLSVYIFDCTFLWWPNETARRRSGL